MQIAFPCKCGEREKLNVVADEADVRQHLIDAHAHAAAVHSDKWTASTIDKPKSWPVRDALTLVDQLPVLGKPAKHHDADSPYHGRVQVAMNDDGTIRSVFTVPDFGDGADVTTEYVQWWDRQPKPAAAELKTTKRHGKG